MGGGDCDTPTTTPFARGSGRATGCIECVAGGQHHWLLVLHFGIMGSLVFTWPKTRFLSQNDAGNVFAKSVLLRRGNWASALLNGMTVRHLLPEFSAPRSRHFSLVSLPSYLAEFTPHNRPRGMDAIAAAPPNVRLILGIILLLLGLGSLSCQVQDSVGDGPVVTPVGQWVRTVDGWERPELWNAPELHVPRLHPLVVAAGQGLVSVMVLVACTGSSGRVGQRRQQR